jgi:hypothetical protein
MSLVLLLSPSNMTELEGSIEKSSNLEKAESLVYERPDILPFTAQLHDLHDDVPRDRGLFVHVSMPKKFSSSEPQSAYVISCGSLLAN